MKAMGKSKGQMNFKRVHHVGFYASLILLGCWYLWIRFGFKPLLGKEKII